MKKKTLKIHRKYNKELKVWAVMPAFSDSKELSRYPYLTEQGQLEVYLTKKQASKVKSDGVIEECELIFKD